MIVAKKGPFLTGLIITTRVLAVLMVVGLLVSTALLSITESLILILWLLLWVVAYKKEQLTVGFYLPMVIVGMSLLLYIFIHTLLSHTPLLASFEQFMRYRELLLLPLLLFVLNTSKWKKIVYYSFLAGMLIILLHSYLQFFGWVPNSSSLDEPNTSTIGRIAGAIMLAFTCYAFLEETLRSKGTIYFWLWLFAFLIGSFALLYFYNGRTGTLIYFVILFVWGFRFLGIKGIAISLLLIYGLFTLLYQTSPSVKVRINETKSQFNNLINLNAPSTDPTRVGLYSRTLKLMEQHSTSRTIIGGGAGSFKQESQQHNYVMTNPHNEYLLIFFENGVIGLLLFLSFFILAWRQSNAAQEHEKWLMRALIITFSVGCLFNSLLLDNNEAHFFVLLLATLIPPLKTIGSK